MMQNLLDYFFPIAEIEATPAASTAFLKQVCLVVSPLGETPTGVITECTSNAAVALLTANTDAASLFSAGMSKVYILPMDDLDMVDALEGASDFFTVLISSDFDKDDIIPTQASLTVNGDLTFTAVNAGSSGNEISIVLAAGGTAGSEVVAVVGKKITITIESGTSTATQIKAKFDESAAATALASCAIVSGQGSETQASAVEAFLEDGDGLYISSFQGVVGVSSDDIGFLEDQAVIANRVAFYGDDSGAKNMCYAFGKLLSNQLNWKNQQYITMPETDGIETKGAAESLFDKRISFVMSDSQFGHRLAFFVVGGKAIVSPYIKRNLNIDMQSDALAYISANQPAYTAKQATLLEDEIKGVIDLYVQRQWIESGTVQVLVEQANFIASGYISIAEPKVMWRILGEVTSS
jgi:hypothetical protein